ncbi:MAG TPA: hypothetical protein VG708_13660 [Mycobacteriales bacterium]|nr:hypothetical protein [Mycobacteriales bacterium]
MTLPRSLARRSAVAVAVATAAGGFAVAGTVAGSTAAAAPRPAPHVSSVASRPTLVLRRTALGKVVAIKGGHVVYLFGKDTSHKSNCSGVCAGFWPPVLVSRKPHAGSGIHAGKIGTITRSNGSKQATYGGHPLYNYAADQSGTAVSGEGVHTFGATWYALHRSGKAALPAASGGTGGY